MDAGSVKLKSEPYFAAWCPVFLDNSSGRKNYTGFSFLFTVLDLFLADERKVLK